MQKHTSQLACSDDLFGLARNEGVLPIVFTAGADTFRYSGFGLSHCPAESGSEIADELHVVRYFNRRTIFGREGKERFRRIESMPVLSAPVRERACAVINGIAAGFKVAGDLASPLGVVAVQFVREREDCAVEAQPKPDQDRTLQVVQAEASGRLMGEKSIRSRPWASDSTLSLSMCSATA